MYKFKIGDKVKILSGKDKGREGKIEKIFPKDDKVLIPDLNIYKRHVKGAQGKKGGIYDVPRPISVAKLALICPKCKKNTKVGFKMAGKEKIRFCKKCKKEIVKA
jgi:large subunit ribosomal protein L24